MFLGWKSRCVFHVICQRVFTMVHMTGYIPTLEQIDSLHHKYAPSQAAYDLIHTHCVVVATITRLLVSRQNLLFSLRCKTNEGSAHEGTALPAPNGQGGLEVRNEHDYDQADRITGGRAPRRLLDERLAVIGGLLHDIGTYHVLKHDGIDGEPVAFDGPRYVMHGILGYRLLLDEGVDESVALFARNHTGVGLTRQQVIDQGLPLPPDDYVPTTLEQEVVMVADKYNSKSVPPKFLTAQSYAVKAARFGDENRRRWLDLVEQYGEPNVPALAERFHMRVV